jgi:hypothetical protein
MTASLDFKKTNRYWRNVLWSFNFRCSVCRVNIKCCRAVSQVVSRRSLIADAWVSPCGIFYGQIGTGTDFSPSSSVLSCQYLSTVAPYSLVYHLLDGRRPRYRSSETVWTHRSSNNIRITFLYQFIMYLEIMPLSMRIAAVVISSRAHPFLMMNFLFAVANTKKCWNHGL